jgi:pSer/pThr/pTyr-binding forkhead associated (FHA) protein
VDTLTPLVPIISRDLTTRWGTANLKSNERIAIHVGNTMAQPVQVCLTSPVVLGRFERNDPDVHVNLESYGAAQKGVSRQHASLTLIAKTVMLTDLNSMNGTFLNGHQLPPHKHCIVRDGDEIRLGELAIYISYGTSSSQAD